MANSEGIGFLLKSIWNSYANFSCHENIKQKQVFNSPVCFHFPLHSDFGRVSIVLNCSVVLFLAADFFHYAVFAFVCPIGYSLFVFVFVCFSSI